ncbi:WD repeat-containing protein 24 [Haplosporangium sp. Z 27]|nr:WD repeat-containing protein 24 [Haplosporangium sp. Z 27]
MNREMQRLRKDPTIPLSAATVTTSTKTTNAFPVSPRLGSTGPDTRASSRHRTSPKGPAAGVGAMPGPGAGPTSLAAPSGALPTAATSMGSNPLPPTSAITNVSSTIGMPGSGLIGGSIRSSGTGSGAAISSGSILGFGNGHAQKAQSGIIGVRQSRVPVGSPHNFKFDTGGALSALSASPDFTMVAVVGRDVLKILSVTDSAAEEMINLKTAAGARNNFTGINMDVKWGPTMGRDAKIATTGTNNQICISGLNSASDLRAQRPGLVMETKDSVREVQFNPVSLNDFVAGYESGNIQRWDIRSLSISEKKFMAHAGNVSSLEYHPNGRFLASSGGGRDKSIKIWDMEDENEKRKEIHIISTIQYASKIHWRPNKPYQLAASFKDEVTVQIFDVRRPFVPLHVLTQHDRDATCLLWKDTDVLWTVSKDKTFASTHIQGQTLSSDLLPSGKAAMNCYGQLAFTVYNKGNLNNFEKDLVPRTGRPTKSVALDGSAEFAFFLDQATVYRTKQTGGVFDCELFNHEAFIFCAQNYSIDAGNIREACEHNSNIAWKANRYRDSQTWTAIKLFYSDMAESAAIVASKQVADQAQDRNDNNLDASESLPQKPAVPSLFAIKVSDAPVKRNWSHNGTIQNLLEYYAEQGEVQMCVTMLLVLSNESDLPEFSRSQQWFASYIDLLSRFKLWSIATAVSQACKDPGIHSMNQDSTTIHTSCSMCMKPILTRAPSSTGFWACDRCRKVLSSCSVCHKTVRGIFTWCAQCSHGFHLQHAQEWFSQSAECPTGCGHQCFPEMLKLQQEQEQQQLQQQQQFEQAVMDNETSHEQSIPHIHQEQVSYPIHSHYRGGDSMEGKGSSPLTVDYVTQ